jgi:hypothetical protein
LRIMNVVGCRGIFDKDETLEKDPVFVSVRVWGDGGEHAWWLDGWMGEGKDG